jgi:hypothetical protein
LTGLSEKSLVSTKLSDDTLSDKEEKALKKKEAVTSLYRYSDLSIENIARQVGVSPIEVQQITNDLTKSEPLQSYHGMLLFVSIIVCFSSICFDGPPPANLVLT